MRDIFDLVQLSDLGRLERDREKNGGGVELMASEAV